jgi:hypothetical protein
MREMAEDSGRTSFTVDCTIANNILDPLSMSLNHESHLLVLKFFKSDFRTFKSNLK